MKLSGAQSKLFRQSLMRAFDSNIPELRMFLDENLNFNLQAEVNVQNPANLVFADVIRRFVALGREDQLLSALLAERPDNEYVQHLGEKLHVATAKSVVAQLEREVRKQDNQLNVTVFLNTFSNLSNKVCRIQYDVPEGIISGTGLLIGPDLVLTNQHVINAINTKQVPPSDVQILFDYMLDPAGIEIRDVVETCLAQQWLIASSPYSQCDAQPPSDSCVPTLEELDFALIKLAMDIGNKPFTDGSEERRGWVSLNSGCEIRDDGASLLIMQHPKGEPLKMTFGRQTGLNSNVSRVRYDANTESGSSGSPVFDLQGKLLALHHAGDPDYSELHKPDYNQGIPITRIREFLNNAGLTNVISQ